MLTNKHVIVAMLVAPILAILAWFATDIIVAEQPIQAKEGDYYKLAEKANCRWHSGFCGLKNKDIEMEITVKKILNDNMASVQITSNVALNGVVIGQFLDGYEIKSKPMQSRNSSSTNWAVLLPWQDDIKGRLHLAAQFNDILLYGDVATIFAYKENKL